MFADQVRIPKKSRAISKAERESNLLEVNKTLFRYRDVVIILCLY